ncbi:3'-5' exonuclease domain-containing protein [Mycena sanguinolenta]|uniref:3'-5' exonuclease domain-containing protein n=1 Tax=Mycena sanguinolenta TaxID=230812 RepID=A0A8H6ZHN9_9AGAR|nr:3'-5' exonuclease domain-containing protein [Mycena sanguinolenta]
MTATTQIEPQVVDTEQDDEDGADGLLNDGLGDEGEESDDEEQAENTAGDLRPSPPSRSRRKLPDWLQTQFDEKLRLASIRNSDGLPRLYEHDKTFWFPVEDPYFALQHTTSLSPQKMFHARFFLWDPAALLGSARIPCPNCRSGLNRHCPIPRPRRCVDLNDSFWVIGYRYICPSCIHPKSKKKTVTFRSWDPRIIRNLPNSLARSFPVRLTHRSGISDSVFMFMRSCFQSGMGAKQFSDALRVRHLEHYEALEIKYLSALAKLKGMSTWLGRKYRSFLPFEDTTPDGYHGFVPSSQWLRDLYDKFIEDHDQDFNQAIALLTGLICAIDHSFKLAKHIAKVNGEQVFIALLTITNEKGEIRVCNLVATKSHSQFELALNRMRESLIRYGHDQPQVFYTDNMSDKDFLERIPATISVVELEESDKIDEAMRAILHDIPQDDEDSKLVLFLDSEWNVETSQHGYVTGRGTTAIVQIMYKNIIYILKVGQILAGGRIPPVLKQLLQNPRILKVGRAVAADLKYLQEASNTSTVFVGAVDIARFAKDWLAVTSAKVGLADLCAKILGKCLSKNVSERISTAWEREQLSESQRHYAALDVFACHCLYDSLVRIPVPSPLPPTAPIGTSVLLFSADRARLIARGTISATGGTYDHINITPTRCLVDISEVIVPAAIITTHDKRKLSDFGPVSFKLVCLRSHLRISADLNLPSTTSPVLSTVPSSSTSGPQLTVPAADVDSESGLGNLIETELGSGEAHNPAALVHCEIDAESQKIGFEVLATAAHNWGVWKTIIRSRVLKDAFHIFNMFYISVVHGLRIEFARALRDAIFIPDPVDKARIIAWGRRQNPPQDWNSLLRSSSQWLWRRCKRIIPPAEELYPLVAAVFKTFGHLKDAKSGLPLFNPSAWAVAKNVLELIQKGFLSDPPGIALYYQLGVDKSGLPLYRCVRGSNYPEGGVHRHLLSHLPTSGAGIRHANASLKDFICKHNLIVGTYNSTGKRYKGHYSIWQINERQELLSFVEDVLIDPQFLAGWVNGNLYQPTDEVAGVLRIPDDVRIKYGMAQFEPSIDSARPHHYLAALQGTRKAILPIHNQDEKDLFRTMMSGTNSFGNFSSDVQVDAGVRIWNAKADANDNIFYKLAEQLKVYYNSDWQRASNIIQTKATTAEARQPVTKLLNDPVRSLRVPSVPETSLKLHHAPTGMLPLPAVKVEPALSISDPLLLSSTSVPPTTAQTRSLAIANNPALLSFDATDESPPHLEPPTPGISCCNISLSAAKQPSSLTDKRFAIVPPPFDFDFVYVRLLHEPELDSLPPSLSYSPSSTSSSGNQKIQMAIFMDDVMERGPFAHDVVVV